MPNLHTLAVLSDLRRAHGLNLDDMARACGLTGKRSRESVGAWERGDSIPHARQRPKLLSYLADTLGLRADPSRLEIIWNMLVEAWDWQPLQASEWEQLARDRTVGARVPSTLAAPLAAPLPIAALPAGSRMPFSPNPLFVGRNADLDALATTLMAETTVPPTVAIAATGMGGIGKTQLATAFVHRYGRQFTGGVFWLSCADPASVPAEIATCGDGQHLALHAQFDTLALEAQVALVRAAWEQPAPRLLVFDNCEDPALLERWRPQQGGSRVLITSRRSAWNIGLAIETVMLGVLSRQESVALLHNHCPDLALDDADLIAIAAELDDLPLALHLAGRFIALYRANVTPASYVQQLRTPAILAHPSLRSGGLSPTGHDQHVARTFALSYARLDVTQPIDRAARALLARAAAFAPGELIPRALLLETLEDELEPEIQAADALARLLDLGLIDEIQQPAGAVRMHRLIVAFVRQIGDEQPAQIAVARQVLAMAQQLNLHGAQPQLLALQPHLRALTNQGTSYNNDYIAALCFELSQHLLQIEDFAGARDSNQRSLDMRTAMYGESHLILAENLHHMGWIMDWQTIDANPYHQRGLAIRRATLGDDHPATAESYNYIGTMLHSRCAYADARVNYEQALAIRERVLGPTHPETAQSLNNLGLLLHAQGEYSAARVYLERALAIREALPVSNDATLSITLNNLGYLLRAMGLYTEARVQLERALRLREQVFGPTNTFVAVTLNHLGRLHHTLGQYDQAWALLEQALAIRVPQLHANHPDLANNLGNLGMVRFDQGTYDAAAPYLEQALAMHERVWGEQHRHTARSLYHLGLLRQTMGQLTEARHYLERALHVRQTVLGPTHPDTANSRGQIGMLLLMQGQQRQAQPLLEAALADHTALLGVAHPYTARSLDWLSCFWRARHDHARAQRYGAQALAIYQRSLGTDHPYTLRCRTHLSMTGQR